MKNNNLPAKVIFDDLESNQHKQSISFSNENDETNLGSESDVKGFVRVMNQDTVDKDGYTDIDTRTRMSPMEASASLCLDTFARMSAIPLACQCLSRGRKRNNVSLEGKGREEMVDAMVADTNRKRPSANLLDKVGGMFGIGGQK